MSFFCCSSATPFAVPAHEVRVALLVEPFRVPEVEILPLDKGGSRHEEDRIGPERRYVDHRRKGHQVPPVIDPAGIAALALRQPHEGAEHGAAELVHENEEEDDDIDPGVAQHACLAPEAYGKNKKDPVDGRSQGAAVGLPLRFMEALLADWGKLACAEKIPRIDLSQGHLGVEPGDEPLEEYQDRHEPQDMVDAKEEYWKGKETDEPFRTEDRKEPRDNNHGRLVYQPPVPVILAYAKHCEATYRTIFSEKTFLL